jgi:hypothetical protein
MATTTLTGSRIRSYRVDRGMRQADLARACEISASYLNLIEHNKRRIGGALLVRLAKALDVDPSYLSGVVEVRVAAAMDAAAEAHAEVTPERGRAEELAARFPGWARLIARQYAENRRLEQVIERLGDRLTHDPFLSASMHNVLTSVTAIRSASGILAQGGDIEPEWEARFHRNIYEDSQRLTDATEALVAYLDSDKAGDAGGALPQDELDAWLEDLNWRLDVLEENPTVGIGPLIEDSGRLATPAARQLATAYAEQYAEDAAALPLERLVDGLSGGRTPAALAQALGLEFDLVFRRLAVLGAGETGIGDPYGLVACDASGTLIYRKPLPGFELPRYSAACPFWPLFQALQRPMTPVSRLLRVSGRDEAQFEALAFSTLAYPSGFDGPPVARSWMLFWPVRRSDVPATGVGTSCRICPEAGCVARREPSVFA